MQASEQRNEPRAQEAQRNAWNRAFLEFELGWQWDAETWKGLQAIDGEKERLLTFVRSHHRHLFAAYDPDFLVSAIQGAKEQFLEGARG
jgi:hypothetical protein